MPTWPDTLQRQQPNNPLTLTHTHQNPRQHIPLRNTTAEWLCYDISNKKRRKASGFGRPKGNVEEREEKGMAAREGEEGGGWGVGLSQGYPSTECSTSLLKVEEEFTWINN